ncbi:MAG: hypothetical protein FWH27_12005 [Planctomycetaceae bacterium]|nr:hypothetical protein [Planctomycetaceae bacterium]
MSEQLKPLTYEDILEMFHRMVAEADRRQEKADRQFQAMHREISTLGSRVGEIIENMVGGDIVEQFQALGYDVTEYSRRKIFGKKGTDTSGEIDLLLENGEIAILIEAKTTLKIDDVNDHIERLEKYRHHVDEKSNNIDRRKFVGAVAAGAAEDNVIKYAQRQGLYVILQAGRTVEIVTPPEGFVAKTW